MKWALMALVFFWSAVIVPVLVAVIQKDVEEGLPWLAERIVRRAVGKMPLKLRERYLEEWLAELKTAPGRGIKLVIAFRLACRADATSRTAQGHLTRIEEIRWSVLTAIRFLVRTSPETRRRNVPKRVSSFPLSPHSSTLLDQVMQRLDQGATTVNILYFRDYPNPKRMFSEESWIAWERTQKLNRELIDRLRDHGLTVTEGRGTLVVSRRELESDDGLSSSIDS